MIKGATLQNGKPIAKLTQYADDTATFAHGKSDLTRIKAWFDIYERASGSRTHYGKTTQMVIGNCRAIEKLPNVGGTTETHMHLGIPVGPETRAATKDFWKIANECMAISETWIRSILSLKGRVMIGNAKIISKVRYGLFHQPPPASDTSLGDIEKAYWRLIRNEKKSGPITRKGALLKHDQGGVQGQNLECIRVAAALALICRMERHPELPSVITATELMKRGTSRTKTNLPETLHPNRGDISLEQESIPCKG